MLKKLYLKQFIFFALLVSFNFNSHCDPYEGDESRRLAEFQKAVRFMTDRESIKVETENKSFIKSIEDGFKQGAAQASLKEALNVVSICLKVVPYSVNKLIAMIKIYAYKWSFGTTGLTGRDLTKFNNRIQTLCTPFATSQVGNMRKAKRVVTIESEQSDGQIIDANWLKRRSLRISELEHIVTFLKNVLPCYNAHYQAINASTFERAMASVLYALSTENNNEIQNYIIRLIGYIKDLINLLESFNSLDQALEHSDETKELLNIIRSTFEHISTFLADGTLKGATFQKIADDSGSKRDLMMDLLGK